MTEWRWVTEPIDGDPDDCNNVLVETTRCNVEGFASETSRKILECWNIDAGDADRIKAWPTFCRLLERFKKLECDAHATTAEWVLLGRDISTALAEARGEGVANG